MRRFALLVLSVAAATVDLAAPLAAQSATAPAAQQRFWKHLQSLCSQSAQGKLIAAPPGDTQIDPAARLVVHFWECGESELRFPLHVAENRSRTWVFIKHDDGIELRHDHRKADGSEESNTWYGAKTMTPGTESRQDFVTVRNGVSSGWRVEVAPGKTFSYGTARNGEYRHHLQFDIASPVADPPLHWGHAVRPSQRPSATSGAAASGTVVRE